MSKVKTRFKVSDGNQIILSLSDLENAYKMSKVAKEEKPENVGRMTIFDTISRANDKTGSGGDYVILLPKILDSISRSTLSNYGLNREVSLRSLARKSSIREGYTIHSNSGGSLPERMIVNKISESEHSSRNYLYVVDKPQRNLDRLFSDRIVAIHIDSLPKSEWETADKEQIDRSVFVMPLSIF